MSTYFAKSSTITPSWYIIDAKDLVVGRLASKIANLLRGKHLPEFTNHVDSKVKIVVINASKIAFTGNKCDDQRGKVYYRHTGHPGGIKEITAGKLLASRYPERVLEHAVKGMLPSNTLSRNYLMKNLYIYPNETHKHAAQQPAFYDFGQKNRKNII